MIEMYGEDNVEFVKIDGNKVYEPSRKYSVQSFPTFVYVQPNTKGLKAIVFRGDRTYDNMKSWMMKILKDLPILNEAAGEEEEEYEDDITEQYTPLPPKVPSHASHTSDLQVTAILKDITNFLTSQDQQLQQLLSQQKKALQSEHSDHKELSKLEENILAKLEELKPTAPEQQPPLVYLLGGVIVGVISAVIMVALINKSNIVAKKRRIA